MFFDTSTLIAAVVLGAGPVATAIVWLRARRLLRARYPLDDRRHWQ